MNEKEIAYCVGITALIVLFVPLGFTFHIWHVGLGMLVSIIACLGLFFTKESRFNIALMVLYLTFPLWWLFTGAWIVEMAVASIAFYVAAGIFLISSYEQVKMSGAGESLTIENPVYVYLAVFFIGILTTMIAPIGVDKVQVAILGIALGLLFTYLFQNIGVTFAMPTLIFLAVLPIFGIVFFPTLIWDELINASLVIAIWSSLGAYSVLWR